MQTLVDAVKQRARSSRRSFHSMRLLAQLGPFVRARDIVRALGVPFVTKDEVATKKRSHRLYILGSGPSINEIDERGWRTIRAHDSYGINFWLLHAHVPTYYSMEFIDLAERPWARDTWARLCVAFDESAVRYRDTLKLIRHVSSDAIERARDVRSSFLAEARFIFPLTLLSRDLDEARRAVRVARRVGAFELEGEHPFLFGQRASIVFAYAFGIAAGYEEIVFCGVDLNRPGHFFNSPRYPAHEHFLHRSPTSAEHQARHGSEVRLDVAAPVSEVIRAVADEFIGVRTFTASPTSALAAFLPVMRT